jgi:hypothetical protein
VGGDEEDDKGEGEDGSRSEEGRPERRGRLKLKLNLHARHKANVQVWKRQKNRRRL